MIPRRINELMECTNSELDNRLRTLESRRRAIEAEIADVVAVSTNRMVHLDDGHHSMKSYLRATCNWSDAEVSRVRRAAKLVDHHPAIGAAWAAGTIGAPQVHELANAFANPRCRDQLPAFLPLLLDQAEHLPFTDFRVCVQWFEQHADVDGAHRDIDLTHDQRTARVSALGDGGVDIAVTGGNAVTTAEYVAIFEQFVEAEFQRDVEARRAEHGDAADQFPLARSATQRRHDAIHSIFLAAIAAPADARLPDPIVNIVVDQATFDETLVRHDLGGGISAAGAAAAVVATAAETGAAADGDDGGATAADDGVAAATGEPGVAAVNDPGTAAAAVGGDSVGEVTVIVGDDAGRKLLAEAPDLIGRRCETTSGIVVHPDHVLRAALSGHVRRVVIDSAGVVVNMGRLQRLFTGSARVAAQLLVRRCSHPGCQVPATLCDVDHIEPWVAADGPTDQRNADARCNPHDRYRHRAQWRSRRAINGRVYSIRADGTIVLPVGERAPVFVEDDENERDDQTELPRSA